MPTPEQLVRDADQILIAKVVSAKASVRKRVPNEDPGYRRIRELAELSEGAITVEVRETLKGELPGEAKLKMPGGVTPYFGPNTATVPYERVRPGGVQGLCFAYDYKTGAEYLLFLKDGTPYWAPLAPTNEEISGPTDPWVWWVKGYLAAVRETEKTKDDGTD